LAIASLMSYLPLGYVVDLNKVKVISAICRINYNSCIQGIVDMYEYDIDLNRNRGKNPCAITVYLCYVCLVWVLIACLHNICLHLLF
jgi:hypothetical protein